MNLHLLKFENKPSSTKN